MIEAILVIAMPFIVKALTQLTKQIKPIPTLNGYRILVVRAIMAVYALGGAILTVFVGDMAAEDIDPSLIETAVLSVINASVATWLYLRSQKVE
jgi:cytosine/uracil/thiamine/allantoin permease